MIAVCLLMGSAACVQAQAIDYRGLFLKGTAYPEFLASAKSHRAELWRQNHARASVDAEVAARARAVAHRLKILVVAIDGCSDSASIIPYIAKLAGDAGIELRIVAPDDGGRAVMEAYKTPDGRAATPTIVLLDENYQNVGVFVERPAPLHAWYEAREQTGIETGKLTDEKLAWYLKDAGRTTLAEFSQLMGRALR